MQQIYPTAKLVEFINKQFDEYYKKLKSEFNKQQKERRLAEETPRERMELQEVAQEVAASQKEDRAARQERLPSVSMGHRTNVTVLSGDTVICFS